MLRIMTAYDIPKQMVEAVSKVIFYENIRAKVIHQIETLNLLTFLQEFSKETPYVAHIYLCSSLIIPWEWY